MTKEIDFYDHAHNKNPIVRYLVSRYFKTLDDMLGKLQVSSILDVGCGSAYVTNHLANLLRSTTVIGVDNNQLRLDIAYLRYPHLELQFADGTGLPFKNNQFDLVSLTQVLEHMEDPSLIINELYRVSNRYVFLSVPDDLLWRLGNLARGKYWSNFGNPEGHIRDWNKASLEEFLSKFFYSVEVRRCYIWLIALCEKWQRI